MFAETREQMKETDRKFAENQEQQRIRSAELDRLIKANAQQIGGIDKSLGEMTEEAIYNALSNDMIFAGIEFYDIDRNKKRKRKKINLEGEFDFVLINGDTVAIIEAKHKVKTRHLSELVSNKVGDYRILFPEYKNHKIILGIGGMCFDEGVEKEAKEKGVVIIKVVGEKVEFYTNNIKTY